MKENQLLKTIELKNSPFDIRFSINQEFSLNSYIPSFQKTNCITRKKERTSFVNDDFRYDLTIVYETENNITKIDEVISCIQDLDTTQSNKQKSKIISDEFDKNNYIEYYSN
jgi:S-adenosylmethionine synthetase